MSSVQHQPLTAQHQAADASLQASPHVHLDALLVTQPLDDLVNLAVQVAQGGENRPAGLASLFLGRACPATASTTASTRGGARGGEHRRREASVETGGQVPTLVLVNLVQTGLQDVGHRRVEDEGSVEDRLEVVNVGLDVGTAGGADLELEGVEAEGGDGLVAQGVDAQVLQARDGSQVAVLRLGRLDDQEGEPPAGLPQFVQQVEEGVGLTTAGDADDQAVLGEIPARDDEPVAGETVAFQYLAYVDAPPFIPPNGGERGGVPNGGENREGIGIEAGVVGDAVARELLAGELHQRGQFAGVEQGSELLGPAAGLPAAGEGADGVRGRTWTSEDGAQERPHLSQRSRFCGKEMDVGLPHSLGLARLQPLQLALKEFQAAFGAVVGDGAVERFRLAPLLVGADGLERLGLAAVLPVHVAGDGRELREELLCLARYLAGVHRHGADEVAPGLAVEAAEETFGLVGSWLDSWLVGWLVG